MSFNIVDIKVVTDYTDFIDSLRMGLNVPLSNDDAAAIHKALASGAWSDIEASITKAVTASAPVGVRKLVAALLLAYSGAAPNDQKTPEKMHDEDKIE